MSDDQSVPPSGPPPPPDQAIADTRVVGPVYRGVRRLAVFLSGVPLLLGGCLLLALVIVVVLNQLDKLLKAMHPAQLPAYGVSSLSPLLGIGSTPRPEDVRHVWSAWSATADTPSHAEPTWVLHWYLGIDLLYTSVTEGCRFETSVLAAAVNDPLLDGHQPATPRDCRSPVPIEANPTNGSANWTLAATKDIDEYVCPAQDVRLSTAALFSARFPIISPSGKIGCKDFGNGSSYVVDGGYYDNTGASTISELWTKLQTMVATTNHAAGNGPCIVPYLIEIDNHYGPPSPPTSARPNEVTVPTTTLNTVRDGHEADWLLGLANQFGKSRVAVIYPRSHPGAEAPLGTLSRTTEKDLEDQLKNEQVEQELETARGFFTPALRAAPTRPVGRRYELVQTA